MVVQCGLWFNSSPTAPAIWLPVVAYAVRNLQIPIFAQFLSKFLFWFRDTVYKYLGKLYDASLSQPSEENKDRLLAHVTSHELTAPGHRERVYEQFGMTERVSVIETNQAGGVLALNLYRYLDQPSFSESDLSMISLLADPLFAIVKKHVEIKGISTADAETINQTTIEQFRTVLALNHSEFSERELDVCARLLYGMSYDGIAADLDLSLSTVKTYRNRAFSRLDINFKSELFRVFLHANRH